MLESPVDQRKGFLANKGFLTKALKNWTLQTPVTWGRAPLDRDRDRRHRRHRSYAGERAEATGLAGQFRPGLLQHGGVRDSGLAGLSATPAAIPFLGPDTFSMNANMSRTIPVQGAQEPGNSDQLDQYSESPRSDQFRHPVGTSRPLACCRA